MRTAKEHLRKGLGSDMRAFASECLLYPLPDGHASQCINYTQLLTDMARNIE